MWDGFRLRLFSFFFKGKESKGISGVLGFFARRSSRLIAVAFFASFCKEMIISVLYYCTGTNSAHETESKIQKFVDIEKL